LLKKYTTNQNNKGKGFVFKDFIIDCVQEITDVAQTEEKKGSTHNESLALTSTALIIQSCRRQPVMDPAVYKVDSKFIKWFMFHQAKK
jgi:hypothetical protein